MSYCYSVALLHWYHCTVALLHCGTVTLILILCGTVTLRHCYTVVLSHRYTILELQWHMLYNCNAVTVISHTDIHYHTATLWYYNCNVTVSSDYRFYQTSLTSSCTTVWYSDEILSTDISCSVLLFGCFQALHHRSLLRRYLNVNSWAVQKLQILSLYTLGLCKRTC